jgi:hypothetical protein
MFITNFLDVFRLNQNFVANSILLFILTKGDIIIAIFLGNIIT